MMISWSPSGMASFRRRGGSAGWFACIISRATSSSNLIGKVGTSGAQKGFAGGTAVIGRFAVIAFFFVA